MVINFPFGVNIKIDVKRIILDELEYRNWGEMCGPDQTKREYYHSLKVNDIADEICNYIDDHCMFSVKIDGKTDYIEEVSDTYRIGIPSEEYKYLISEIEEVIEEIIEGD